MFSIEKAATNDKHKSNNFFEFEVAKRQIKTLFKTLINSEKKPDIKQRLSLVNDSLEMILNEGDSEQYKLIKFTLQNMLNDENTSNVSKDIINKMFTKIDKFVNKMTIEEVIDKNIEQLLGNYSPQADEVSSESITKIKLTEEQIKNSIKYLDGIINLLPKPVKGKINTSEGIVLEIEKLKSFLETNKDLTVENIYKKFNDLSIMISPNGLNNSQDQSQNRILEYNLNRAEESLELNYR